MHFLGSQTWMTTFRHVRISRTTGRFVQNFFREIFIFKLFAYSFRGNDPKNITHNIQKRQEYLVVNFYGM